MGFIPIPNILYGEFKEKDFPNKRDAVTGSCIGSGAIVMI
jgi:hypothetical protein